MSPSAAMHRAYSPEPQDFVVAASASVFAIASFAFPDTGVLGLLGSAFPRGYAMGAVFTLFAAAAILAGLLPSSGERRFLSFVRLFYPQAFIVVFFMESILLSSRVFGGVSHDAAFAAADQWLFGFQPSREFHRAFGSSAAVNEIMFGSYFLFYVVFTATPWIAWLAGKREEARLQLFISVSSMLAATVFYIFFRVQGPKYYFADLRDVWYGGIQGGIFVSFFQRLFSTAVLSGAAFPSTHVALTAISAYLACRTDRRLLAPYLAASILILSSTVYIYAHYFADVLGGLAYALAAVPLLFRAYPRALGLSESLGSAISRSGGRRDGEQARPARAGARPRREAGGRDRGEG